MNTDDIKEVGRSIAGPIITAYVSWLLNDAACHGVKRIYFLARDGYSLQKTAEILCRRNGLDIECRYLYCSRISLRVPSFHLIGDEGTDLLCIGGYHVTPDTVLDRLAFSDEEKAAIFDDLGLTDHTDVMDSASLAQFKEQLRNSRVFCKTADMVSKKAYGPTMRYFRQEGLFDQSCVVIADSGWTGSMQRSLRQLLRSEGYTGKICGYYFGMFSEPSDDADGEYKTWYFDRKGRIADKVFFCNNLLECMLSAPHGMTLGFKSSDKGVSPVLAECSDMLVGYAHAHSAGIAEYAEQNSGISGEVTPSLRKHIHKVMVRPTEEMLKVYGGIGFCDDLNEKRMLPLADHSQVEGLKKYLLLPRICNKVFHTKKSVGCDVYWPFGTAAYLDPFRSWWYRMNIYAGDFIRYSISK